MCASRRQGRRVSPIRSTSRRYREKQTKAGSRGKSRPNPQFIIIYVYYKRRLIRSILHSTIRIKAAQKMPVLLSSSHCVTYKYVRTHTTIFVLSRFRRRRRRRRLMPGSKVSALAVGKQFTEITFYTRPSWQRMLKGPNTVAHRSLLLSLNAWIAFLSLSLSLYLFPFKIVKIC